MTFWSYDSVREVALGFSSKADFENSASGAYAWARRHKVLEDVTSHMQKFTRWGKEAALKEAKRFTHRESFAKERSGCVKWLIRHNLFEEACAHMTPRFRWDFESVKAQASNVSTREDFHKFNSSAAQWANRNNRMEDLFPRQQPLWDFNSTSEEALKYQSREAFRAGSSGAAHWAERNGVWDVVCAHMEHLRTPVTLEEAIEVAKQYATRSELYYKASRVYAWALRQGVLDDICTHMLAGSNSSASDVVYMWNPVDMSDVFKFGVTSDHLSDTRIKVVARSAGVKPNIVAIKKAENARDLEKELLSLGSPFDFGREFCGYTEFRKLDPDGIVKAKMIMEAST